MSEQSKLGRGLDALLGTSMHANTAATEDIRTVPIEKLAPGPYQPRSEIDEDALNELADSIRAHGIIQPIVARISDRSGYYEIIAGERRWRAAQRAALHEVPVLVRDIPDRSAMAISLIENIQREDLNPVEQANLLKRLSDEFSMSHKQIAESIGRSRASVTNMFRLLTLSSSVLEMLNKGRIEVGHAKVLLSLKGNDQSRAAKAVVRNSLSVRQTEALVKQWNKDVENPEPRKPVSDANITRLEAELSDMIGAQVGIHDRNGKGFVKIRYHSLDELDGILSRIR